MEQPGGDPIRPRGARGDGLDGRSDARAAHDGGAFLAGDASADADDQIGVGVLEAANAAEIVEDPLLRFLAHRAGVEKDHIRVLRAGSELASLPVGSHLDADTGEFAWQPGVGFTGTYDFVTVDGAWDVNWVDGPPTAADLGATAPPR